MNLISCTLLGLFVKSVLSIHLTLRDSSDEYLEGMGSNLPATIRLARPMRVLLMNGCLCVHSSYRITPRLQMSVFSLYALFSTSSGDKYSGVP